MVHAPHQLVRGTFVVLLVAICQDVRGQAPVPAPPAGPIILPGRVLAPELAVELPNLSSLAARFRPFHSDIRLPGSIDSLVADLHDAQFDVRTDAMDKLLHLGPERLSDVRDALAREKDPEAAARLTAVAAHLFLKNFTVLDGNSSLLGIKLGLELIRVAPVSGHPQNSDGAEADLRMSVVVAELQPGYPAAQDLHIGDRLIAIDGERFPIDMTIDDFKKAVTTRRPGSLVNFTIIREGRQLQVPVQLAGLPPAGLGAIEMVIDQRNQALDTFLAGLKSQADSPPQVLEDRSTARADVDDFQEIQPQVRILIGR
jgi:hypothetical protein